MSKIVATIILTAALAFGGITPLYSWAIPITIGLIVIAIIVMILGILETEVDE